MEATNTFLRWDLHPFTMGATEIPFTMGAIKHFTMGATKTLLPWELQRPFYLGSYKDHYHNYSTFCHNRYKGPVALTSRNAHLL